MSTIFLVSDLLGFKAKSKRSNCWEWSRAVPPKRICLKTKYRPSYSLILISFFAFFTIRRFSE